MLVFLLPGLARADDGADLVGADLAADVVGTDGDVTAKTDIKWHWRETWAGADISNSGWSVYSGVTISPFGAIQADGFRLRLVSGYGRYAYQGARWTGRQNQSVTFLGAGTFTDLLAGYQKSIGPLTVKAFAGAETNRQLITPFDPDNAVQGEAAGFKAAAETWLNLANKAWLSANFSWSDAHSSYAGDTRLGYRITPQFSSGLEAAAFGNAGGEGGRAGAFARYEWASGEVSIAGGFTGRIWDRIEQGKTGYGSPYGSASWATRF